MSPFKRNARGLSYNTQGWKLREPWGEAGTKESKQRELDYGLARV